MRAAPAFVRLEGDVVPARRAKAPVKLDGELDEWTDVPAVPLKGSALSGGLFKAMWDESALYVAVAVRDADVKACDEQGIGVNWRWGFDGVTLRVNTSDTGELLPTDAGTMLPCGYQAVSLAVSGRKSGYPLSLCVSPANVRFAAKPIEGGYVLEAAIPAREYGILPVAGASIGFDLQLHGAVGTFCRYSKREGALYDGRRLGRLQFTETGR